MTAVGTRHQFDDGAGFAVTPHPKHNAFVGPFHESEHNRFLSEALSREQVRA
jgi:hypothetical protein